MTRINPLGLDPATYQRDADLHAETLGWMEKNCYVDVWIEFIHALGCEPMAMMPFVVALDFEGDQWTFFKPKHNEMFDLYGIDVQELTIWKPLLEHAIEHLPARKFISVESDAWWLPDTSGTDYRNNHVKSTIIIADLDVDARRMGYFHNAAFWEQTGEDFARTFRLAPEAWEPGTPLVFLNDPTFLPFFAEVARIDKLVVRPEAELKAMSRELLKKHASRMPSENPFPPFAARFAKELPAIQQKGLAHYHAWAFASLRQIGSAAELASLYLGWLGVSELMPAADAYASISAGVKSFILKGARAAANTKKTLDAGPIFSEWAAAWDVAKNVLQSHA